MSEQFLSKINWQQPWLLPLREIAHAILQQQNWQHEINRLMQEQGLCNFAGQTLHCIPQLDLPEGVQYEAHIYATGGIPTRDNLHDFFNALMWLRFPQIKKILNHIQAMEIQQRAALSQSSSERGLWRDAATLFDENAALWVCSDPSLTFALQQHAWTDIFQVRQEDLEKHCEVLVFGHALLEKLTQPYKAITAHAWVVQVEADWFAQSDKKRWNYVDKIVSQRLQQGFDSRDFTPLPVLGLPNWCEGQDADFYADQQVFRPPRSSQRK
jgi:hypothetical protein